MPPAMIFEPRCLRRESHPDGDQDAAELGQLQVHAGRIRPRHELAEVVRALHRLVRNDRSSHRGCDFAHPVAVVCGAGLLPALDGVAEPETIAGERHGDGLGRGVPGVGVDAESGAGSGARDGLQGPDVGVDVLADLDLERPKAAADPFAGELRHSRGLGDGDGHIRLERSRRKAALAAEQRAQRDARAARHRVEQRGLDARARHRAVRKRLGECALEVFFSCGKVRAGQLDRHALDLAEHVVLVLARHRREAGCLTETRFGASTPAHMRTHLDRARRVDPPTCDDERVPQRDRERPRAQMFDS